MLPHHGHDHSRLSELQFETVDQDPGARAIMRCAVEGRLRKLEQTGWGKRLVVVHGHDEAERERQLAALEVAGRSSQTMASPSMMTHSTMCCRDS